MLFERYEAVSPELRITINALFLVTLHLVNGARCWALRGLHYPVLSPRWLHGMLIHGTVAFASLYGIVSIARHGLRISVDYSINNGKKYDGIAWAWRQEELLLATAIFQVFSLWLVKAALISIYAEFIQKLPAPSRRLLWTSGILIMSSFFMILSLHVYWCPLVELEKRPISQLWSHRCVAESLTPYLTASVFNILTDLMLLLTGLSIVYTLRLTTKQIRASSIIFFIAFLTISAACIRMGSQIFSYTNGHGGFEPYPPGSKLTAETLSNIATDVEVYVSGIAACLPGIRLFMRRQSSQVDQEKMLESESSEKI